MYRSSFRAEATGPTTTLAPPLLDAIHGVMATKLFIVSRDQPELFRSLRRAIASEPDVDVIYDRRLAGKAASREQVERRTGADVTVQLRERGFAVVHMAPRVAADRPDRMRRFRF